MNSTEHRLLPVGAIVAYAGTPPEGLEGWLVCDGSDHADADEPELAAAIGTAFGTPGTGRFNVPALCGTFLRAVAGGADTDPGRDARQPSRPGGAAGDRVGSAQTYGTAPPTGHEAAFGCTLPNAHLARWRDIDGCETAPAEWNYGAQIVETGRGGDLESRPVNKAVWWLIKSRMKKGSRYTTLPAGSVVAHAVSHGGQVDFRYWVRCSGEHVTTAGVYQALHAAIGFDHGRSGVDTMVLPDYRGWFLRGVDGGALVDPDASRRTAPYPQATDPAWQGNTGDRVGSCQGHATGLPYRPMQTRVHQLPSTYASKHSAGLGARLATRMAGATWVDLTARGGDKESRPINLAVDWYVCKEASDGRSPEDRVPVGTIVSLGGSPGTGAEDVFLPCDGRLLEVSRYGELFAVIGNLFGGDPVAHTFALPDARGMFLRGADHDTGVDPDAASRTFLSTDATRPATGTAGSFQGHATARPVGEGLQGQVSYLPTDSVQGTAGLQSYCAEILGDLAISTCKDGGGDGETRPVNVYASLHIKARG